MQSECIFKSSSQKAKTPQKNWHLFQKKQGYFELNLKWDILTAFKWVDKELLLTKRLSLMASKRRMERQPKLLGFREHMDSPLQTYTLKKKSICCIVFQKE